MSIGHATRLWGLTDDCCRHRILHFEADDCGMFALCVCVLGECACVQRFAANYLHNQTKTEPYTGFVTPNSLQMLHKLSKLYNIYRPKFNSKMFNVKLFPQPDTIYIYIIQTSENVYFRIWWKSRDIHPKTHTHTLSVGLNYTAFDLTMHGIYSMLVSLEHLHLQTKEEDAANHNYFNN